MGFAEKIGRRLIDYFFRLMQEYEVYHEEVGTGQYRTRHSWRIRKWRGL